MSETKEKTILIIDDQKDFRFILTFDLKKNGYKTIEAENGEKGIEIAKSAIPDLILLDRKMPGADGIEVCKRLKADNVTKDIPVLMITGKSQTGELTECLEAGAVGILTKPFKFENLLSKIKNIFWESAS